MSHTAQSQLAVGYTVNLYVGVFEFSYRIETQNTVVIGTSHCL